MSPEPAPKSVEKGKGVASSSKGLESETTINSSDDVHMKLEYALQTIEMLKKRVEEAHEKYDALLDVFQVYIRKDYDETTPQQPRKEKGSNFVVFFQLTNM